MCVVSRTFRVSVPQCPCTELIYRPCSGLEPSQIWGWILPERRRRDIQKRARLTVKPGSITNQKKKKTKGFCQFRTVFMEPQVVLFGRAPHCIKMQIQISSVFISQFVSYSIFRQTLLCVSLSLCLDKVVGSERFSPYVECFRLNGFF